MNDRPSFADPKSPAPEVPSLRWTAGHETLAGGVSIRRKTTWRRKALRHLPFGAAVIGMILIFSSVMFVDGESSKIAAITAGILVLLVGMWCASYPIFPNERRYLALRAEFGQFIDLVTALNRAATPLAQEFKGVKAAMHESVERMAMVAAKRE